MEVPTFTPASGWYQPGAAAPSSYEDSAAMRAAALPCTVVVLRQRGQRIRPAKLLMGPATSGLLLATDRYTHPHWNVGLYQADMSTTLLPLLLEAQLVRERGGVRLYRGVDPGEGGQLQGWLVTPTPGRAREILLEMLEESGDAL